MKNIPTLVLRIAITLGGLFVLAFIILAMPEFIEELVANTPNWFYLPVLIAAYLAALPFYFVLYQTFKLLRYIDTGKAFSKLAVGALKKIKYAAFVIGGLFTAILPLLYILAEAEDAPGLLAVGIVFAGTAFVVATFAAVIQMVLHSAIEIKKENDLTV